VDDLRKKLGSKLLFTDDVRSVFLITFLNENRRRRKLLLSYV